MVRNFIKNVCFLFVFIILFSIKNVNATGSVYTAGDFSYTVDSFTIKVYDASNDSDGNSKYFTDRKVLYTIPLDASNFTYSPEMYVSKLNGIDGTFINLNLSIDKTTFESLVKEKVGALKEEDSYLCELDVNYTMNSIPSGYPYLFHINTMDLLISIFSGGSGGSDAVSLNASTYQVLNFASFTLENGVETFLLDEEYSSNNSDNSDSLVSSIAIGDYLLLSKNSNISISTDDQSSFDGYIFMMHNMDNIQDVINSYNDSYNSASENISNTFNNSQNDDQVISVPNTKLSKSKIYTFVGLLLVVNGILLINVVLKNRKYN